MNGTEGMGKEWSEPSRSKCSKNIGVLEAPDCNDV